MRVDDDGENNHEEMQQHDQSGDSSFHNNRFITDVHGNYPPQTTTSADLPRSNLFYMMDPLNPTNADQHLAGTAFRFPTQGSSDEIPSGGAHNMLNDENLLNGSSLDGLHDPIGEGEESAHHMKIEE